MIIFSKLFSLEKKLNFFHSYYSFLSLNEKILPKKIVKQIILVIEITIAINLAKLDTGLISPKPIVVKVTIV